MGLLVHNSVKNTSYKYLLTENFWFFNFRWICHELSWLRRENFFFKGHRRWGPNNWILKFFNKNFTNTYQICIFYMVNCLNKIFHWIYKKKNSKNVPVLSLWNPPNPLNWWNAEILLTFINTCIMHVLMHVQVDANYLKNLSNLFSRFSLPSKK